MFIINSKAGGACSGITKVSYHVLGTAVFGFGLILVLKLPNIEGILGDQFFNLPTEGSQVGLHMAAASLQMIGILLYLKWFGEHGKKEQVKLYKKYEPIILLILIFLTPVILNAAIASTVKAYVYAGKSGSEAVEIIQNGQPCPVNVKQKLAECAITLKNYNHTSQKVLVQLYWPILKKSGTYPVYLIKQQEKTAYLQIPPLQLFELKQLKANLKEQQPQITIH